jgi:hypothetical protein
MADSSNTLSTQSGSAKQIIYEFLAQYGLGELADWAWGLYTGLDGGPGASIEEIRLALPSQKAFQERFPAYDQLAKEGRAISPNAYIAYEQQLRGYLQQFGVPAGMYDTPQGIANLLIADVSAEEARARLSIAADAAFSAPQEVRDALRDRYGLSARDLVGFYLDPEKALPLLQQQYTSAQIIGAAQQQTVDVATETAERLAAQGVNYAQAREGFGTVNRLSDLTAQEQGGSVSQGDLVGAAFGDGDSGKRVDREIGRRVAQYRSAEGGAAAGNSGVSGLRSARS